MAEIKKLSEKKTATITKNGMKREKGTNDGNKRSAAERVRNR